MEKSISEIFSKAIEDPINLHFSTIIFFLFILGLFLFLTKQKENFREYIPTLCITIGVFGTFWGLFIGLQKFDTSLLNIQELLDGVKTAFFTSIIGMLSSLILRACYSFTEKKTELNYLIDSIYKNHSKTQETLSNLMTDLSGKISSSIDDALKNILNDFNVKLNDLVGKSFIDLKTATENLNQWQQQYKSSMDEIRKNILMLTDNMQKHREIFSKTNDNLEKMLNHFEHIEKTFASISSSGKDIEVISNGLQQQSEIMKASLDALVTVGKEAKDVIPHIKEKMESIITQIDNGYRSISGKNQSLIDDLKNNIQLTQNDIKTNFKVFMKEEENESKILLKKINSEIGNIHYDMQKELASAMIKFGDSLAKLSQRFTSDYTPLVEKLKEFVSAMDSISNLKNIQKSEVNLEKNK